ncbi:hypothetical protein ACFX1X_001335 [Malus domestica]
MISHILTHLLKILEDKRVFRPSWFSLQYPKPSLIEFFIGTHNRELKKQRELAAANKEEEKKKREEAKAAAAARIQAKLDAKKGGGKGKAKAK